MIQKFTKKLTGFILITLFIMTSPCLAQEKTLAIAPFSVSSEKGLDYLKTGMIDMFSSRLVMPDKIHIIDKATSLEIFKTNEGDAKNRISDLAGQTQADLVVTGTLTESDQGVELHVVVINPADMQPVLDLTESSEGNDATNTIIPLVDLIAGKINRNLFSRDVPREEVQQQTDVSYNIHAHPDTLLESLPQKGEKK